MVPRAVDKLRALLPAPCPRYSAAGLGFRPGHKAISVDAPTSQLAGVPPLELSDLDDTAPRLLVKNGGTRGIPYGALKVAGIENLLCAGIMINSDRRAHISTGNTVCCMGQGQSLQWSGVYLEG